ncbi:transcriptional attenuator, LytR family [Bifidobacterium bohemicum]|uniref:Cell envelope-related transcriptional attenuator n=1 Tax=Bifidobacterium bohemicum DSM 22767 TaxID=1437606 RepID=A0A086ZG05_9BIFI|nr:LCP family protein [Bifidobacterium bohemicum]KFI45455.1 cell envelope-related transcriptional attenuator [Bifidobacterium bohemicum DSM 22767]SCB72583.1 transcriptional attenuator, LytR family [Bifidobacterium bohemicum]
MASHRMKDKTIPNINGWRQTTPKHGTAYIVRHRVRRVVSMTLVGVLVTIGSAVGAGLAALAIAPRAITIIQQNGRHKKPEIIDPNAGKPIDLLVLGQDTRSGAGNSSLSGGEDNDDEHNADTAMVVQIAADRSYINIVSIPRDSLVDAPACHTSKGTVPARYNVMFNSIFASGYETGGDLASAAGCTVNAVNSLTGLDIQQFVIVDFEGLKNMIDDIGGVDLCIPVDTHDDYTWLDLHKGMQHLDGTQATKYARMRHGTGTDGTDIMRTTRQQYLIKQLMNKALSLNLLTDSSQLYRLSRSALNSLSISSGLADLSVLVGLAMSMKNLKVDHIYAQTISVVPAPDDPNRRVWTADADEIWAKLRENKPLSQAPESTPEDSNAQNQSKSNAQNGNDTAQNGNGTQNGNPTPEPQTPSVDPVTGLIKNHDGTLIDPNTGGYVDPENGSIRDPKTNEYIGIAYRYLNTTVCGVPAQK